MTTVTLSDLDAIIATTEKAVLVAFKDGRESHVRRATMATTWPKATPTSLLSRGSRKGEGLD
jgi:hypothetical protein